MTTQTKQPTHFIEVVAHKEGFKQHIDGNSEYFGPIESLERYLHTTSLMRTQHTIAIFKIYPKTQP